MKIQLQDGTIENVYSMEEPEAGHIKINNVKDLIKYQDLIPEVAFLDINKRMWDWLGVKGNSIEDNYILNQLHYAQRLINRKQDVILK